ncbi:MAG: ABC transporter permease [Alphaproteobacteria bacterium]|nr:ABC transporter permease [Alphaproteobacteria bacterium]
MTTLRLALTFARRELRGGFRGFRVFFLCLLLGSAAISGVESLSTAFLGGLRDQGQTLLGGDVSVQLTHRPATADERKFLDDRGTVSEIATMRAMVYSAKGPERTLVELKAVDRRWPLVGAPDFTPAQRVADVLACEEDGVCGAAAEQALVDRLHVKRGDLMKLGNVTLRLMAVVNSEPDRISGGFGINLGPRLLVSSALLPRSGLIAEGSLVDYTYRLLLKPQIAIEEFRRAARQQMRGVGWRVNDRRDAVPGLRNFIEQVSMFLTLVGLTALCVGGAGAGQAILAFLDRKRADIAILKSMGTDGRLVFLTFLLQVMGIAFLATLLGAAAGAVVPFLVIWRYGAALPVPPHFGLYASPILLAMAFGLLTAVTFTVPPLSRGRVVPPASLFRDTVDPSGRAPLPYLFAAGAASVVIVLLALWTAPVPRFAAEFMIGGVIVMGMLRLAGQGLKRAIAALPRPRSPLLRLALANLTRPGAATGGIITALGLGLTLLATVTLLGKAVEAQVQNEIPATAPSFFFVDIQKSDAAAFDAVIHSFSSASLYQRTPMIRGRIVAVNGVPSRDLRVAPDARWAFNGDRGITYAATPPPDTEVTAGKWWPADYDGPTQISLDQAVAQGAGLKLGDTMRLNVLGREIEGRITSLRQVNFRNLRQNFVLVLSPGVIDKAPHAFLATVRVEPKQENAMYMAVTDRFPSVSTVRVRDAIAQLDEYLQKLSEGISIASLLTIVAGLLVLAGAITAGTRARVYDATILKVQGAGRPRIALVHAMEFGLLGLITAALALVAGTVAAWAICHFLLRIGFLFDVGAALATVAGGAAAVLLFGLIGAVAALGVRPARVLRAA